MIFYTRINYVKKHKKYKHYLKQKVTKGFVTILLLFVVIILGIFLSGGISPKFAPADQGEGAILDESTLPGKNPEESLQLKTFKFKECKSNMTVSLMLDHTGSMADKTPTGESKLQRLKEAILTLLGKMNDESVVGIQSFHTPSPNTNVIREEVPISYFKDVKGIVADKINALNANGATPTHDALVFSRNVLQEAIPRFTGRTFNFIFISDGAPCPGIGCPNTAGPNQDPRGYNPNPADQIRALGVNVYALAIYDKGQSGDPNLAGLMRSIASKPENYFAAETADDTTRLLSAITEKICQ